MQTCGMSVIKYVLFVFNLIFVISGIAIIAAGGAVLGDVGQFGRFMDGKVMGPPIVLIVVGAIVFFIAFLGCYGAIQENYCCLMAFAGAMLVIFLIELAVGIAAAVFRNDFSDMMRLELRTSMRNYSQSQSDKTAWDDVQTKLRCCGIESERDWIDSGALPPGILPYSCCKDANPSIECLEANAEVYRDGCFNQLKDRVEDKAGVLIGVAVGIPFIQVAGIVFACCLAITIKKEGDK